MGDMREWDTLKPLPLLRETGVLLRAQSYLCKCWQMVKLLAGYNCWVQRVQQHPLDVTLTSLSLKDEQSSRIPWQRGEIEFLGYLLCKTNLLCLLVYNISLLFSFVKNTDQTYGLEVNSDALIGFTRHSKSYKCLPRTYLTGTMQSRQRAQVTL